MFLERLRPFRRQLSIRLTLWHSALFMVSAVGLLVLTYVLLRNRANATEHYVLESRLNQYVSEYRRGGLPAVQHLATLRRGRAQQAFFVRVGDAHNDTVFLRHAEDWAEFAPTRLVSQPLPPNGTRSWKVLPSSVGTKLPDDLNARGDATALFRVFANVLDNAIKYTERNGVVTIEAEAQSGFAVIQFSDTGIGICEEDLPRIWDRHFRSSRGREQRGLGLGLSFVRAIVQAHGGQASITPRAGGGTTVRIELPVG